MYLWIFFNDLSWAFTTKMIDTNKDCSLQPNFDWRLTNKQCNYSSKKSRNKSVLSKGSLISLATKKKGEGGGTLSKTQGFCSFFSKNCHLKGRMQYHLPIQLQLKLEHLEFFSGKNHYYNIDLPIGLFHCVIFLRSLRADPELWGSIMFGTKVSCWHKLELIWKK